MQNQYKPLNSSSNQRDKDTDNINLNVDYKQLLKQTVESKPFQEGVRINLLHANGSEMKQVIQRTYNIRRRKDISQILIYECGDLAEVGFRSLYKARKHGLCTLKKLKFKRKGNEITNEDMAELSRVLSLGCSRLQQLDISCGYSSTVSNKGMIKLAEALGSSSLSRLQHLRLHLFNHRYVTEAGFIPLGKSISKNLCHLKSIMLKLNRNDDLGEKTVESVSRVIRRSAHTLESIKLRFLLCKKFDDNCLITLSKQLRVRFPKLDTFDLGIFGTGKVGEFGVVALSDILHKELAELKKLKLSLYIKSKISDQAMQRLGQSIQNGPPKLEDVEITFEICGLTDEMLSVFSQSIAKGNSNICKFDYVIRGSEELTDVSINELNKAISGGFSNLTELRVDVRSDYSTGGKIHIKNFDLSLNSGFSSLKSLDLTLANSATLGDNSLNVLNRNLARISNTLEHLSYNLSKCKSLTNALFFSLGEALSLGLPK